ncbi:uncharacterized protein [Panulirus ornatus]|uniref:uncharacterized protein isoform X3 n=1 Tax=Panulirus ornatus TaxID=150431 RepID=UPI003A89EB67
MLEFGPMGSGPGNDGLDSGNFGSGSSGWEESLDLDWLTDHEVRFLLPPTQRTRYQTKVFQQSVTILIKLQPNTTSGGASAVAERGVAVGPWRVSEEQLPVLVGTITGASLLLLLLLSLLLYTCCHHSPTHKNFSVKSEVSSVTSGRTQGSAPSLSRDSLVVVTHASSGHQQGKGDIQEISNNNSVRSKVSPRPTSNPVAFSPCDLTLPRPTRQESRMSGEAYGRTLEGSCLPLAPESRLEEQSASSSALDTVFPVGRGGELEASAVDEAFRTRSLPAWVRNKSRPLATLDDLNTIYEKPNWSKRRRNRMRSDAAAVIALSKSRGRLLSPSPQAAGQTVATATPPDTAALVENEAVIVYDERTAL